MLEIMMVVLASVFIFMIIRGGIKKLKKSRAKKVLKKKIEIASNMKTAVYNEWTLCELSPQGNIICEVPVDAKKASNKEGFSIGRKLNCDYTIKTESPYISGVHAKILQDNKGFYILDNNSVNHMYVDQKQVKFCPLSSDKVIFIGNVPLFFRHNTFNMDIDVPEKVKSAVDNQFVITNRLNEEPSITEKTKKLV